MEKTRLKKHTKNLRKSIQVIFWWSSWLLQLFIKHLCPVLGIDDGVGNSSRFLLAYS